MTEPIKPMTTKEFSKVTGISTAAISKLIRDGKIKATKEGKVWIIPASQLESNTIKKFGESPKRGKSRKPSNSAAEIKAVTVSANEAIESEVAAVQTGITTAEEAAPQPASEPTPPEKSYSISEFADMTYLTEKGVTEWLRIGRLWGCKTETGEWRVLESNLTAPGVSHLVRR